MRITKIENQKKHPDRKNIYVDGQFFLGVSAETLMRSALRTDDEVGREQLDILQRTEELLSAKNAALRYLSTRPRTEREVRDKLREKEYGEEEIARAIDDLKRSGLLNDEEFSRMYIRDALASRPAGKLLLKKKLLLLGVDKATVDHALHEAFQQVNQEDAAMKAATQFMKKTHSTRKNESALKLRNRLTSFLVRRGYTWNLIETVLKGLLKKKESLEEENE